jgi:hypothetical protein
MLAKTALPIYVIAILLTKGPPRAKPGYNYATRVATGVPAGNSLREMLGH